jgi:hypothetical protein
MTALATVTGALGLAAVGFAAWQIGWRRRFEASVRRIPLRVGRQGGPKAQPPTTRPR